MLYNDRIIVRVFGEVKNYKLIFGYLDDFSFWLDDLDFRLYFLEDVFLDLVFIIVFLCLEFLKRKLDLKNIEFI